MQVERESGCCRGGADGFGTISGILTTPVTIAKAVGPLGGAALAEAASYRPLILAVAAACVTASVALALTRRMPQKLTRQSPEADATAALEADATGAQKLTRGTKM